MAPTTGPSHGGLPPDHRPTAPGAVPHPPPPGAPGSPWPAGSTATAVGWAPPPVGPPPPPGAPGTPGDVWHQERTPREPDPAPRQLLAIALVAGLALELGLRGGIANLLVALGLIAVVAGLVTFRRLRQRPARLLALGAAIPIAFLAVRASSWLVLSNLVAAGGLVVVAIAFSRSGRPTDATLRDLVRRLVGAIPAACTAPLVLVPLIPRLREERTARLVRVAVALAVCVPVLAVVAALLAAADPVFAGLLLPDIDVGPAVGHATFAVILAAMAVCVIGSAASDTDDHTAGGRFGRLEVVTMLAVTAAVLGLFVLSQLIALTSAGQRLVERSGLTPAEYARSGFFQLCWATGLILSLLAAIRALAAPEVLRTTAVRVLGALVPALALGLVVVSLRRMALYDAAFGLTMLRLWVLGAAAWMGIVLVLLAVRNAGLGLRREWVLAASGAAALALLLLANIANPEAFVARHNLDRADEGAELDLAYLAELSDDAAPAIADAWDGADAERRAALEPALRCGADADGARRLNLAVDRAAGLRADRCASAATP